MNGKDVKVCPFHEKLDKKMEAYEGIIGDLKEKVGLHENLIETLNDKVEYHDKFLHKVDKKVDRFTWMSGLQLVTLVAILIKLFLMSLDMMAKG